MVTEECLVLERLILLRCLYCGKTLLLAWLTWRCFWHPGGPKERSSEAARGSVMGFGSLDRAFVVLISADSCEMTFINL